MLSVAVHKDIAEYQPKIVGKMTMRTLVSITGALSVSVLAGLYIYFVLGLNVSDCTYFIYAVSLPFWCVGFVKPCGMPFEQFAPLWLKANFTNDRIFYKPSISFLFDHALFIEIFFWYSPLWITFCQMSI